MSNDSPTPDEAFGELHKRYLEAVEAGDADSVEAAALDIFALAGEYFEENPSAALEAICAASDCEERGDWVGAERLYREVLSASGIEPMTECQAHSYLAALYRLQNRATDASAEYLRAVEAARRAETPILVATALVDLALSLILEERYQPAETHLVEVLGLTAEDEAYGQVRARALLARAACALHRGNREAAEFDLECAFDLLLPMAEFEIAAGVQRELARYWSLTAMLHDARDNYKGAVDAWQRAVALTRHVASLPHCASVYARVAVANSLDGLAKALAKAGRADEAARANKERAGILEDAGLEAG
jgi:tetratricopeptide (TPR) repeat protein